jgi:uncharacterized protein YrrD
MSVDFTPEEIAKVPSSLRPLMQKFPVAFDNLLEMLEQGPINGKIRSQDIYFDDESFPAFGFTSEGVLFADVATETPTIISAFINNECAYVQVGDRILGSRIREDYLAVFPL